MTWDYEVRLVYKPNATITEIQDLLIDMSRRMFLSPLFTEIGNVKWETNQLQTFEISDMEHINNETRSNVQKKITFQQLSTAIKTYAIEENIFWMKWLVPRFFDRENDNLHRIDEANQESFYDLHKEAYVFEINYCGAKYSSKRDDILFIDLWNAHHYDVPNFGKSAKLNLEFLLRELQTVIPGCIESVFALDAWHSDKPEDWTIRYHQNPQGFVNDLVSMGMLSDISISQQLLSQLDLRTVIENCEHTGGVELYDSYIVYSTLGCRHNLKNFYAELLKYLTK